MNVFLKLVWMPCMAWWWYPSVCMATDDDDGGDKSGTKNTNIGRGQQKHSFRIVHVSLPMIQSRIHSITAFRIQMRYSTFRLFYFVCIRNYSYCLPKRVRRLTPMTTVATTTTSIHRPTTDGSGNWIWEQESEIDKAIRVVYAMAHVEKGVWCVYAG